jgi:hypothetical protein
MKITAIPGTHEWRVTAQWYGAERTVFTGDPFEAIAYTKENS